MVTNKELREIYHNMYNDERCKVYDEDPNVRKLYKIAFTTALQRFKSIDKMFDNKSLIGNDFDEFEKFVTEASHDAGYYKYELGCDFRTKKSTIALIATGCAGLVGGTVYLVKRHKNKKAKEEESQ